MKYVDSKWQSVTGDDVYKLTKLEGQVGTVVAPTHYYILMSQLLLKHLFAKWQHIWHNLNCNKLHNIYSSVLSPEHSEAQLSCSGLDVKSSTYVPEI